MKSDLEFNISTHNRVAKRYEQIHGEIYNGVEQLRLREDIQIAISKITTDNPVKRVLDFGCGAGNLTWHLVSLGCEVIAGDVSSGFLDLVSSRSYGTRVETVRLNGNDLSNIKDKSVDMVATYSVLHHVPDYLGILAEFIRILKPGGVVYIDHEPSSEYWGENPIYRNFKMEMKKNSKPNISQHFDITNYIDRVIRRFINPRFQREGDIHVYPDDHIEWDKVTAEFIKNGAQIAYEKDYLLFRRGYAEEVYMKYKNVVSDMHVLVVKKAQ